VIMLVCILVPVVPDYLSCNYEWISLLWSGRPRNEATRTRTVCSSTVDDSPVRANIVLTRILYSVKGDAGSLYQNLCEVTNIYIEMFANVLRML
jgi:hypothetical protein